MSAGRKTFPYNGNGMLSQASDGARTWAYLYDASAVTNLTCTVTYGYDRNSNRTSLSATVGNSTFGSTFGSTLAYDELNRLVRVEDRSGTSHGRFGYDERGWLVKWATTGDVYTVMEYDSAGPARDTPTRLGVTARPG